MFAILPPNLNSRCNVRGKNHLSIQIYTRFIITALYSFFLFKIKKRPDMSIKILKRLELYFSLLA